MSTRLLDVQKLLEMWDPWKVWGPRITPLGVQRALQRNQLEKRPYFGAGIRERQSFHTQRIAYLVVHSWDDPIDVEVGCGSLGGRFCIEDGNHRLCAAQVRGDKSILASAGGLVSEINRLTFKKRQHG